MAWGRKPLIKPNCARSGPRRFISPFLVASNNSGIVLLGTLYILFRTVALNPLVVQENKKMITSCNLSSMGSLRSRWMRPIARSDISANEVSHKQHPGDIPPILLLSYFRLYNIMASISRKKKNNNKKSRKKKTRERRRQRHVSSRPPPSRRRVDDDDDDDAKEEEEDSLCMICWQSLNNGSPLSDDFFCEHRFHVDCIDTWCRSTSECSCPVCRRPMFLLPPAPPPPPPYTGPRHYPHPTLVKRKFNDSS